MEIELRKDRKRDCGWRKPGGLYLITRGLSAPCGKLPIPLHVCPTCGGGIKFCRGWTWIEPARFLILTECDQPHSQCCICPLGDQLPLRAGLIWIGAQFYCDPWSWEQESRQLGVSRRIRSIPRDFLLGETWVFVAHRKVIKIGPDEWQPAIFHVFQPHAIEYVVRGDESADEIDHLRKRGITPVEVEHVEEQAALFA